MILKKGLSTVIIARKPHRTSTDVCFKIRRLKLKFLYTVDNENKNFLSVFTQRRGKDVKLLLPPLER